MDQKRCLRSVARFAVVASALAVSAGCADHPPLNVVLVTFDTTRADRIGCYGHARAHTPNLDRAASSGIRFVNASSAVPITAPSHSTILTGLYPIAHGVRDNGLFVLSDDHTTLAEFLRDAGYATAAAIGAYPVTSRFGFDQGFELFDDHVTSEREDYLGQRAIPRRRLFFDERPAGSVNQAVLPWLDEHTSGPFFLWVHYFDPHQPFEPPAPYSQLFADDLYDGEIAYADASFGALLDHLEARGVMDRTVVVMTADHGEGLGDHNEETHAVLAYESTLHVPLIITPPPGMTDAGLVVTERVGTVDIVPTVLDMVGLPAPNDLDGRSLVPLLTKTPEQPSNPPPYYAENLSPHLMHGWGELRVFLDGNMKYLHGPRPELYDLSDDPGELRDLAAYRPQVADRLHHELAAFLATHRDGGPTHVDAVDSEVRQRLEALGYVSILGDGVDQITETLTTGGIAPSDRVGDLNDLSAAKHLLFQNRHRDALAYTTALVDRSPESNLYLELHTSALAETGRVSDALAAYERLRRRGKPSEPLVLRLAVLAFESGERVRALHVLDEHLSNNPSAPGECLRARLLLRDGDTASSRSALVRALEIAPGFTPARVDLAVRLSEDGEPEAAEREFLQSLDDAPYSARVHYNYGVHLLRHSRVAESRLAFRRVTELAPNALDGYLALVAIESEAGNFAEAEAHLSAIRGRAPGSPQALEAASILEEADRQTGQPTAELSPSID